VQHGEVVIDLNDAAALIENADQWRQLYTANFRTSQAVDQRVRSLATWLPESVDWPSTEKEIRSIGESAGLKFQAIKLGDRHVGTRVGVVSSSCDVQGSYSSLCRFLSALDQRPQPIACSEIKLHRTAGDAESETERTTPLCRATLSLRIPFAASGTAAGSLLRLERKDAD
jgi:Tfp pilus assembly protein PilO